MPNLKIQSIIEHFLYLNKHVFTINDVAKVTKKKKSYLSRLLPTNPKIKRIERGKYYIDGGDIYEMASNIVEPSYVSLMGAFRYYGLTTQMPVRVSVITTVRHRGLEFGGTAIEFVTFKASRVFGYKKIGEVRMATVEKSILDALYLGKPPYADIEEAFEKALSKKAISIEKLKAYAIEMDSAPLISRLGFMLESFGAACNELLKYKAARDVLLFGRGSKKDSRWGVLYD
jgi:predicted transcriptional regulator of viral defense system